MGCGRHHARDCADVLADLYLFLDNEADDASCAEIRQHLIECGPCLAKYNLDRIVKHLVARSCCDPAPEPLRQRVKLAIRSVQVQITTDR